jgi:Holliday junction resolvase RusA-like endonuclease
MSALGDTWVTVERVRPVRFDVPGEPVAWKRMSVDTRGKRPRFYEDAAVTAGKAKVVSEYLRGSGGRRDLDPAKLWGIDLHFELGVSKQRKDIDNLAKLVLDALTGWSWKDDRQVAKLTVTLRRDSREPRTMCRIYEITEA